MRSAHLLPEFGCVDQLDRINMEPKKLPQLRPRIVASLNTGNSLLDDRIVDALEYELEEVSPPPKDASERRVDKLFNREGFHIIKDDDFPWLSSASSAAISLVKGDILGIVPGLIALLYKYRRLGTEVSARQGAILLTLKKAPPVGWDAEELVRRVPLADLSPRLIDDELDAVQRACRKDGEAGKFLIRNGTLWKSCV